MCISKRCCDRILLNCSFSVFTYLTMYNTIITGQTLKNSGFCPSFHILLTIFYYMKMKETFQCPITTTCWMCCNSKTFCITSSGLFIWFIKFSQHKPITFLNFIYQFNVLMEGDSIFSYVWSTVSYVIYKIYKLHYFYLNKYFNFNILIFYNIHNMIYTWILIFKYLKYNCFLVY